LNYRNVKAEIYYTPGPRQASMPLVMAWLKSSNRGGAHLPRQRHLTWHQCGPESTSLSIQDVWGQS